MIVCKDGLEKYMKSSKAHEDFEDFDRYGNGLEPCFFAYYEKLLRNSDIVQYESAEEKEKILEWSQDCDMGSYTDGWNACYKLVKEDNSSLSDEGDWDDVFMLCDWERLVGEVFADFVESLSELTNLKEKQQNDVDNNSYCGIMCLQTKKELNKTVETESTQNKLKAVVSGGNGTDTRGNG